MPLPTDNDAPECKEIDNVSRIWGFVYDATIGKLVAKLAVYGATTPNQDPWDKEDNPDGWRRSQLATIGFVDDVVKEMAEEQRITNERILALNAMIWTLCEKTAEANGISPESLAAPSLSISSEGEVIL